MGQAYGGSIFLRRRVSKIGNEMSAYGKILLRALHRAER
jgi:hypothetical protein